MNFISKKFEVESLEDIILILVILGSELFYDIYCFLKNCGSNGSELETLGRGFCLHIIGNSPCFVVQRQFIQVRISSPPLQIVWDTRLA